METIEVTLPMIYKAVAANCALRNDGISSYSADGNMEDSSFMTKALAAYFILKYGYSGPTAQREVASSDVDWAEVKEYMNKRPNPAQDNRYEVKKKLIQNHINFRLEKEAEILAKVNK